MPGESVRRTLRERASYVGGVGLCLVAVTALGWQILAGLSGPTRHGDMPFGANARLVGVRDRIAYVALDAPDALRLYELPVSTMKLRPLGTDVPLPGRFRPLVLTKSVLIYVRDTRGYPMKDCKGVCVRGLPTLAGRRGSQLRGWGTDAVVTQGRLVWAEACRQAQADAASPTTLLMARDIGGGSAYAAPRCIARCTGNAALGAAGDDGVYWRVRGAPRMGGFVTYRSTRNSGTPQRVPGPMWQWPHVVSGGKTYWIGWPEHQGIASSADDYVLYEADSDPGYARVLTRFSVAERPRALGAWGGSLFFITHGPGGTAHLRRFRPGQWSTARTVRELPGRVLDDQVFYDGSSLFYVALELSEGTGPQHALATSAALYECRLPAE